MGGSKWWPGHITRVALLGVSLVFAQLLLAAAPLQAAAPNLVINEIHPGTGAQEKWVEVYNRGSEPAMIEGWRVNRGASTQNLGGVVPAGTVLAPGGFYTFTFNESMPLSSATPVYLRSGLAAHGEIIDVAVYPVVANYGQTHGRSPNGADTWRPFAAGTKSAPNPFLAAPTLLAPANGAVMKGDTLTQSWQMPEGAQQFIYESYYDEALTRLRWRETLSTAAKTTENVAETTFWWRVQAVDDIGWKSDWSAVFKVAVDTTAPVITMAEPVASEGVKVVEGTASDAGGFGGNQVQLFVLNTAADGSCADVLQTHSVELAGGAWSLTLDTSAFANATYCLKATIFDAAGHEASDSGVTRNFIVQHPPKPEVKEQPVREPPLEPLPPIVSPPVAAPTATGLRERFGTPSDSHQTEVAPSRGMLPGDIASETDVNGSEAGLGLAESRDILGATTKPAALAWYWLLLGGLGVLALAGWLLRRLWRSSADSPPL